MDAQLLKCHILFVPNKAMGIRSADPKASVGGLRTCYSPCTCYHSLPDQCSHVIGLLEGIVWHLTHMALL